MTIETKRGAALMRSHIAVGALVLAALKTRQAQRLSNDPVALGALAARCRRRIRVTVVQRPQHGNAGHHNNAALLGGRDQTFHGNLPVLALGLGRRQRKDINASIA